MKFAWRCTSAPRASWDKAEISSREIDESTSLPESRLLDKFADALSLPVLRNAERPSLLGLGVWWPLYSSSSESDSGSDDEMSAADLNIDMLMVVGGVG